MGPQVDGEHQGIGVRVGGGGDHGELGPRLSFKSNLGLFTFHHVQALVVASNLTYENPYFLPPSGPRQPNNKVCKMARAPCIYISDSLVFEHVYLAKAHPAWGKRAQDSHYKLTGKTRHVE